MDKNKIFIVLMFVILMITIVGTRQSKETVIREYKNVIVHDTLTIEKIQHDTLEIHDTTIKIIEPKSKYCFENNNANLVSTIYSDIIDDDGTNITEFPWSSIRSDKIDFYCNGTYTNTDDIEECTGEWILVVKEIY